MQFMKQVWNTLKYTLHTPNTKKIVYWYVLIYNYWWVVTLLFTNLSSHDNILGDKVYTKTRAVHRIISWVWMQSRHEPRTVQYFYIRFMWSENIWPMMTSYHKFGASSRAILQRTPHVQCYEIVGISLRDCYGISKGSSKRKYWKTRYTMRSHCLHL